MRRCQGRSVAGARRIHGDVVATIARSTPAWAGEWAGAATSGGGALDGNAGAPCWTSAVRRAMASSMRERRASRGGAAAWLVDGAALRPEACASAGLVAGVEAVLPDHLGGEVRGERPHGRVLEEQDGRQLELQVVADPIEDLHRGHRVEPQRRESSSVGLIGRVGRLRPSRMTRSR